ncbi:MAG: Histidine kinase [Magnetococcales bacterium]|nr:Histidine kinase [Magnetococcales bacterium]HIJ84415.1 chemotaxis protein CheA [Magnetococcales bacterium]
MFDAETKKALLEEFFSENREALGRIEKGLLKLESQPDHRELIHAIFRDMHTVKGNCRMMGFSRLEELTHKAETVLDLMRDEILFMSQEIGSSLLGVVDRVRKTLQIIAKSGSEGEADFSATIQELEGFVTTPQPEPSREKILKEDQVDAAKPDNPSDPIEITLEDAAETPIQRPTKSSKKTSTKVSSQAVPEASTQTPSVVATSQPSSNSKNTPPATSSLAEEDTTGTCAPIESVRLSLDRLDTLMNQVGELGASFNQLKYVLAKHPDQVDQILELHSKQIHWLQDEVIKYRLQPIGRIWDQYHRLVRDLAVETGKKVVLDLAGEETEVDRNVLVSINELLGHLIRNAMDHGIESPEERVRQGKPAEGRIDLRAEQKHGQIFLEIRDDGRGIDPKEVLAKALDTGLVTHEQSLEMNKPEILKLIMVPGFSTARQISKISGRGTGMDVVQSALNKVGGTITIASTSNAGSTFRMSIPQTMAIVPALLISDSGETFAIPQVNIVELASFYGDDIKTHVEGKMQFPMVRFRDKLLPLIPLQRLLRRDGPERNGLRECERIHAATSLHVAILQTQDSLFGLEVGVILGHASLLIKPINRIFSHIQILAGTAVMPDGRISFLLNVPALLHGVEERDHP